MNLVALVDEHPFGADEPLIHDVDTTLTKAELIGRIDELAESLEARADVAGRAVAVIADGIELTVAMFACWRAGAVFVPVNQRQPRAAIDELIASVDPAAVIEHSAVTGRTSYTEHSAGAAFVTWTSGTTGAPKPILHTHSAYLELIDRVLAPLRGKPRDPASPPSPNLIPVSMALNAGIYNALFGLRAGAPLVLMGRFDTHDFATLVARHQIRSTVLPPAAMVMLNDEPSIVELNPLRYVRSVTAPLSPFQARRFTEKFGVMVLNGYGQAEIGEVIGWTAADGKAHPGKVGAVGRAHPGVEIKIESPDGNGVGELLVRPPNHAIAMADDRFTTDGYVRTGDLARIDDDEFVWIEGRNSDLINRGGNKVFPDEVEEVLAAVAGVSDVAVVARPDDRLGEVPVAVVVGAATDADLEAAARAHLVAYKVPVAFHRRDELPRSEVGKLLRRQIADQLRGQPERGAGE